MSDSSVPKTWREAVSAIVWVILVFAAGFEGIATLVHAEWISSIASFSIMVGLTAINQYISK
jgi:general stress protein CsbA